LNQKNLLKSVLDWGSLEGEIFTSFFSHEVSAITEVEVFGITEVEILINISNFSAFRDFDEFFVGLFNDEWTRKFLSIKNINFSVK